jgi:hypothetical protein
MNGKGVRSFWLNALIITTVILMWVTIAGSAVAAGYVISAVASDSPSYDYGSYDEEFGE